jgi:2-(1,2-epoxy-1,2-dihydrophenyl)acetyl-CoA isomerase
MNAVNYAFMSEFTPAVLRAAEDPHIGCVVITGAGRGFCAGGDLKEGAAPPKGTQTVPPGTEIRSASLRRGAESSRLLHEMPKITIAMVNGPVAGAGIGIAGACDLRFAAPAATFLSAYDRIGGAGDYGATWTWNRILGSAKARELFFMGQKFAAEEALAFGLYTRLFPEAELREQTLAFAKRIASGPTASWAYLKANLNAAEHMHFAAHLDMESNNMGLATAAAASFFKDKSAGQS